MKKILLLLSTGLWFSSLGVESIFPTGWTATAILINHQAGKGSGFLLQHSNKVFLVTAKHVLFNDRKFPALELLATNAVCTAWLERTNVASYFEIDLAGSFAVALTRGHPTRDVAVVAFGQYMGTDLYPVIFITSSNAPRLQVVNGDQSAQTFKDVEIGSDIFTFGYPTSIGLQEALEIDQQRPLIRHGIISDKDPIRRILVLDSPVYKGNSGGPILLRELPKQEKQGVTTQNFKVIGVTTRFIPFVERWANNQFGYTNVTVSNSGYSIGEPIDFVLELCY